MVWSRQDCYPSSLVSVCLHPSYQLGDPYSRDSAKGAADFGSLEKQLRVTSIIRASTLADWPAKPWVQHARFVLRGSIPTNIES